VKPRQQSTPARVVNAIARRILLPKDAPVEERETLLAVAEERLRGAARKLNGSALRQVAAEMRGGS
jgi:hypothetical protein